MKSEDLVIYPLEDGIGFVSVVDRMQSDTAIKIVNSARISYDKKVNEFTDKDKKLVEYLWSNSHTSPFRHTFYTFHIKAPLFVFRQWVKYQVGSTWRSYEVDGQETSLEIFDHFFDTDKGCSWNELSGRYVKLDPEFYLIQKFRANPVHGSKQSSQELGNDFNHEAYSELIKEYVETSFDFYNGLIEQGIAKEIARMYLPQCVYTQAYWTVSLQGILHFLSQRLDKNAQYEIRAYAYAIFMLLGQDFKRLGIQVANTEDLHSSPDYGEDFND